MLRKDTIEPVTLLKIFHPSVTLQAHFLSAQNDRHGPPLQKSAIYQTGAVGRSMITASTFGPCTEQTVVKDEDPLVADGLT